MPSRKTTPTRTPILADIAREAGLALSTVSEILYGKPGYSDKTRQRVNETAKRLGYRPNQIGQTLRRGKSMTIGIITPTFSNPVQVTKLEGIESAARDAGYLAYIAGWGRTTNVDAIVRSINDFIDRRVDGIIFNTNAAPDQCVIDLLREAPIPLVYSDWAPPDAPYKVVQDRTQAIRALAQHLVALGHRTAAVITSSWTRANPQSKLDLIRAACQEAGIKLDDHPRWHYDPSQNDSLVIIEEVYHTVRRALKDRNLPTAIIAGNDDGAAATIAACQDVGLAVPRDVSVVGFNGDPVSFATRPALTTIQQPRHGVGEAAFGVLHAIMNKPGAKVKPPQFPLKLITRESTGPAPKR